MFLSINHCQNFILWYNKIIEIDTKGEIFMKSRFVNDVKQEHILTPILVDIVSEFLNILD